MERDNLLDKNTVFTSKEISLKLTCRCMFFYVKHYLLRSSCKQLGKEKNVRSDFSLVFLVLLPRN